MVVKVGDEYKPTYGLSQFTEDLINTEPVKKHKILQNAVKFGEQLSKSAGEAIVDVMPSIGNAMPQRTITKEAPEITQTKKFLVSKLGKEAIKVLSNVNIKDINLKPVITNIKDAILDSDVTIDEAVKIIESIAKLRNINLNGDDIKTVYNFIRSTTAPGGFVTKVAKKTVYKLINRLLTGGQEDVISEINYVKALRDNNIRGPFESKSTKKGEGSVNKTQTKSQKKRQFTKKNGGNDTSWYTAYQSLLGSVSNLQWQYPNGSREDGRMWSCMKEAGYTTIIENKTKSVPTFATFNLALTVSDIDSSSYISRIYSTLRRANSGAINYKIKDISTYLFNIRLILAFYSSLRRAYGLLTDTSRMDLRRPYVTFSAIGYDYNTFAANAANLRTVLKQWAKRLETYMPYSFNIFKRSEWLFENMYLTSDACKDQIYVIKPRAVQTYYAYSGIPGTAGTFTNIAFSSNGATTTATGLDYATAIANFVTLCENFTGENTNAIIAGDMLKAFGAEAIHKLGDIPEDYKIEPVYNKEVLDQISNITLIEAGNFTYSFLLADDHGTNSDNAVVRETITKSATTGMYVSDPAIFINTDANTFTSEYVLAASRFMCAWNTATGDISQFGTEVVENGYFSYWDGVSTNMFKLTNSPIHGVLRYSQLVVDNTLTAFEVLSMIKSFDYMPKLKLHFADIVNHDSVVTIDSSGKITSGTYAQYQSPYIYDWGNWAPITPTELQAMHNTAVMSLYYCPLEYRENKTLTLVSK